MLIVKKISKMVNNSEGKPASCLEDLLTAKHLNQIMTQWLSEQKISAVTWKVLDSEVSPAGEGLTGFLGDHARVALHVQVGDQGSERKIRLFIKSLPQWNKPKTELIDQGNFFRREMLLFKLFESPEFENNGQTGPWRPSAYICDESMVVMPDLSAEGYTLHPSLQPFDLRHALLTVSSLARLHAAYTNYETRRSSQQNSPYTIMQEYANVLNEPSYGDTPWTITGANVVVNLTREFSTKIKSPTDLGPKVERKFIEACDSVKEYPETVNVIIHKDLWANNVMFLYENNVPREAVLIDFQCTRYAPPAFDLMIFLYLTTSTAFREEHEETVFHHYFSTFWNALEPSSKLRMKGLGYNYGEFLSWCEKSRLFGMVEASLIFPFVLMDAKAAHKTYNDPTTYDHYMYVDRSDPVTAHARDCPEFRQRFIEVTDEFFEKYISSQ